MSDSFPATAAATTCDAATAPERRGCIYLLHDLSNVPIPRARWEWDGVDFSYITVEIATRWSDPVVGITWELPSWLSRRLDRYARAGRPIWGDHPLPVVAGFFALCLAGTVSAAVLT